MRNSVLLIFAVFIGFLGAPEPGIAGHIKIVALGDSDTDGRWLPKNEAYPAQLEAALRSAGYDVTVENAGVSGDTSEFIRRRATAATQGAQIVILQGGANDSRGDRLQQFRTIDASQTIANIDAIVRDSRARNMQVLLFQGTKKVQGVDDIASRYGAVYLGDFYEGVPWSARISDGHCTAEGYAIVVRRILPQVKAAIDRVELRP